MKFLHKVGRAWNKFQAWLCRYFGRTYKCGCGHSAKWKTILVIHGEEGFYTLSKEPDWCPKCFAKAAIRCAWCERTILPGHPITLYTPGPVRGFFSSEEPSEAQLRRRQTDFAIPDHVVVYKKEPRLQLVGCLGWGCADCGGDRAGFWEMPGQVRRVMTADEQLLTQEGDILVYNNLFDPDEAIPIDDE